MSDKTAKFIEKHYNPYIKRTAEGWEAYFENRHLGTYETAGLAGFTIDLFLEEVGMSMFSKNGQGQACRINNMLRREDMERAEFKTKLLAGEFDDQLKEFYGVNYLPTI